MILSAYISHIQYSAKQYSLTAFLKNRELIVVIKMYARQFFKSECVNLNDYLESMIC